MSLPPPLPPPPPPRVPPPLMMAMPIALVRHAPRRRPWIILAFATLGVLMLAGMGWVGLQTYKVRVLDKHRAATVAPVYVSSPAADGEARAISAALDRLNSSMQRKSVESTAALFDTERLADELIRLRLLDSDPALPQSWWNQTVTQHILLEWFQRTWSGHKVTKVLLSEDGSDAVVYDMEYHGQEREQYKVRWWMHKNANHWLVWDREYLESGPRTSIVFASVVSQASAARAPASVTPARQKIGEYVVATQKNDLDAAQTALNELDQMSLPPEMKAVSHVQRAGLHFRQGKYREVLADCDAIEATGQNMPVVSYYRTLANDDLGNWAKALEEDARWEDATGVDQNSLYYRGHALEGLNRKPEAIAAYHKSVEFDPESAGSLARLSILLPPGPKPEVTRLFMLSRFPATVFRNCMPNVQQARDLDGMEAVIRAYHTCPESGNDPFLAYYESELKIIRKDYKNAETDLLKLVPLANVKGQECFEDEYLYTARLAGDALVAYENVPDKQSAFLQLARQFADTDNTALARLVAKHLPSFPSDPWAHFYNAKLYQALKQPAAADAAYARAMALARENDIATFRYARVYARYTAGNGLSAYHDIKPADRVFLQLANLFSNSKQPQPLFQLVAARRLDAPEDATLPLWEGQAQFLAGDYEGALASLTPLRGSFDKGDSNAFRWRDLYIRSQIRLKRFDLARVEANVLVGDYKNWWQIALVEVAAGNVTAAIPAMDAVLAGDDEADATSFYDDPDMGPALAGPAFASWRLKHPRPATRPADSD